jgi:hypothetical protein
MLAPRLLQACRLPLLALVFLSACSKQVTPTVQAPDPTIGLEQLGKFYQYLGHEHQRPPTKVADLSAYPPESAPDAWPLIQSGDIVVVWGGGYSPSSNLVLAYEKDAETKGGKVLLQNGKVKAMTPEEFKAAPKAK